MRQLPYLNGIRAFEAAARLGSIAAAAKELNVTAAAVSRMVKLLEDRMEVSLFRRQANRLQLSDAGSKYLAGLSPLLDNLANLTEQVRAASGTQVLTVGVGPTFAIRWLIPRLAGFATVAPHVEVRITTGGVAAPFSDDWTCGIKLGNGDWPGLIAEPLFAADLIPVCSPDLAKQLKTLRHLEKATLLRVSHSPNDWPDWLQAARLKDTQASGPVFEYYNQAIQAASDGVGVALGIRPYIDDDVAAGRLVTPFKRSMPKGSQWYLIYRNIRRNEPAFDLFRTWVRETARANVLPEKR